ncbi:MAG: helix-turn-helix domain-containing protein [Actinobacteria bacterium]|nr:helix-turn-helix domain-containing protein [Actinomycetota bacterium]
MELGEKIRETRQKRGLSQAALAEKVGTYQQTIEKIESGTVKHSRYLLPILEALELPFPNAPGQDTTRNKTETAPVPLVGDRDLPVYGAAEGGEGALVVSNDPVDYVRRPAPLAQVKDGYGIIIVGESMMPELKPGETALVHPHLPPVSGEPCAFYSDGDGEHLVTVKSFIRSTASHWHVEQWNPAKKFSLDRKNWQRCHRIVGKYSRR